ncbi:signal peptide peptidase-like 2A isoform X1 [Varroa destructor]|uniref:Signal peptide peptidase-like 2B n=2 Tax=Varroa destructor TaxID=109461 RepID=A0A7M7KFU1_VARDE|nr:signal peptide peptidase-like 2A isoform X1 [Varroa destructor]XP_022664980.1 signal peptide peptidase-like 2A isoform X1 [Varroa destructor]XP_022664981.1 signal peptide peptidase-like 2A isoform X1 [Varroa destructor]XP_022664982.1 signal peptide peptidase-like 2A isoform X1 [Varroa destructor]XP_022664983.1 signal peptide peptidase-like 2A isoform X1 [Varroa destructor]XP_022664984.1 signal peptide peptidase-like 2A isoform X1 [Varroa destructor]XP_022664985.1 signal peptide peptidase-l
MSNSISDIGGTLGNELNKPRMLLELSMVQLCAAKSKYAVLKAKTAHTSQHFCMIYFPEFKKLPSSAESAVPIGLVNATTYDSCNELPVNFKREAALTRSTNVCPVERTIVHFKKANATALIMASNKVKFEPIKVEVNETRELDIVVGYVSENTASALINLLSLPGGAVEVWMFACSESPLDYSLVVIWFIAVFTVAVGAFWSGRVRLELFILEQQQRGPDCRFLNNGNGTSTNGFQENKISQSGSLQGYSVDNGAMLAGGVQEESSLDVSPLLVSLFVVCMGAMLILLYFFFQYLVYFIIGMFAIASVTSLIGVLEPVINRIPIGTTKIPRRLLPCFYGSLQIRHVFLIVFAIALTAAWLLLRHKPWSWALQDLLGVAFSLNMLRTLRLPNLLICSVLLVLLFFYDIFFVFVTPFLTMKGESVMVEVARGAADTQEQLPMVLRVPHLGADPLNVCFSQFSLLGFGDILVPGLLVSYCHAFDLLHHRQDQQRPPATSGCCCCCTTSSTSRLYYIVSVVFYGIGLMVTFVALYLMETPQPALLYLVPCTLLPVVLVAACRGELRAMWRGNFGGPAVSHSHGLANGGVIGSTCAGQRPPNHSALPPYGATETDPAPIYQTDSTMIHN